MIGAQIGLGIYILISVCTFINSGLLRDYTDRLLRNHVIISLLPKQTARKLYIQYININIYWSIRIFRFTIIILYILKKRKLYSSQNLAKNRMKESLDQLTYNVLFRRENI